MPPYSEENDSPLAILSLETPNSLRVNDVQQKETFSSTKWYPLSKTWELKKSATEWYSNSL